MKALDKLMGLLGIDKERAAPMPRYRAISDGLLVTSTHSETVLQVATSNTDLLSDAAVIDEVLGALRTMTGALQGMDCQLKIVWGRTTGESYAREIEASGTYNTGDWQRWVADRAENIDQLDMPSRFVLLHVVQGQRDEALQRSLVDATTDAFGLTTYGLSEKEHAHHMGRAQKLARRLNGGALNVTLAPAELIAWEVARESRRPSAVSVPASGTIVGAPLAALTRGRVVPFSDHLRFYGADGAIAAYGAMLALIEFPEEVETPGNEWLRDLSDITVVDDDGHEYDAVAEASVRFTVMRPAAARKEVNQARSTAKEQRQSASKGSAGEPPEEVLETEERMGEVGRQINREGLRLVEFHPRIMVTAETRAELDAKIDAVVSHYENSGIVAYHAVDDQRDMWLESLPGDTVRVPDLRHVADAELFFGSLFWGGSAVGESSGPIIGWMTGSTPGFVRSSAHSSSKRRDATTIAMLGLSGRGKSVSGDLIMLDGTFMGGWNLMLDFKGDLGGVVNVAAAYDLPHSLTAITEKKSGALDLFGAIDDLDAAKEAVARTLQLLSPGLYRQTAEVATLAATDWVAQNSEHPSTAEAIQWLVDHSDPDWKALGEALARLASTSLGRPVAGPRTSDLAIPAEPGLWVIQMPGLTLPSTEKSEGEWDQTERLSLALMRSVITTAVRMTSSAAMRALPKTIMIPEVHRLLKVGDGAAFLDNTARMGSAYGTHLILDSQDVTGIASHEGLVEQIVAAFVFQLQSEKQQDAAAEVLGLSPNEATRSEIVHLADPDENDPDSIRKGHCIHRDYRRRCARVQFQLPTQEVQDMLDTNAYIDRTSADDEGDPDHEAADPAAHQMQGV